LVEEPKYEVLKRIEGVEIRKYNSMLLATARGAFLRNRSQTFYPPMGRF
jgi:hypothetical protein